MLSGNNLLYACGGIAVEPTFLNSFRPAFLISELFLPSDSCSTCCCSESSAFFFSRIDPFKAVHVSVRLALFTFHKFISFAKNSQLNVFQFLQQLLFFSFSTKEPFVSSLLHNQILACLVVMTLSRTLILSASNGRKTLFDFIL